MAKLNTTTSGVISATLTADSSPTLELQENGVTFRTLGSTLTSSDLSTEVIPVGVNQTWTNVTASRSTGTTYTNTTGRPIMVVVSPTASGSLIGTFNIAGSAVGVVQHTPSGGGGGGPFFYIIPNNVSYSVTNNSNFAISTWYELR